MYVAHAREHLEAPELICLRADLMPEYPTIATICASGWPKLHFTKIPITRSPRIEDVVSFAQEYFPANNSYIDHHLLTVRTFAPDTLVWGAYDTPGHPIRWYQPKDHDDKGKPRFFQCTATELTADAFLAQFGDQEAERFSMMSMYDLNQGKPKKHQEAHRQLGLQDGAITLSVFGERDVVKYLGLLAKIHFLDCL